MSGNFAEFGARWLGVSEERGHWSKCPRCQSARIAQHASNGYALCGGCASHSSGHQPQSTQILPSDGAKGGAGAGFGGDAFGSGIPCSFQKWEADPSGSD